MPCNVEVELTYYYRGVESFGVVAMKVAEELSRMSGWAVSIFGGGPDPLEKDPEHAHACANVVTS